MQGLNDSLTVGVVVTLVFGALFFYLYSRLVQNEKRVNLIESILLDLKMSADAGYSHGDAMEVEGVEPISGPEPLDQADVDEDSYKQALEQLPTAPTSTGPAKMASPVLDVSGSDTSKGAKVQPNYASMTVKELKALAKQRGLSLSSNAGRKELTEALRKLDGTAAPSVSAPASVAATATATVTQSTVEGAFASEGGALLEETETETLQ